MQANPLKQPTQTPEALLERARKVRMVLLDVDGVLTDGRLYFSNSGEEMKTFHTLDGQGIRFAIDAGIDVGIITGRESALVTRRAQDLGISVLFQGVKDKAAALDAICAAHNLHDEDIAYAGDDAPDVPVLERAGLAVSVPLGHACAHAASHAITRAQGGSGAVRELIDFILASQGKQPF